MSLANEYSWFIVRPHAESKYTLRIRRLVRICRKKIIETFVSRLFEKPLSIGDHNHQTTSKDTDLDVRSRKTIQGIKTQTGIFHHHRTICGPCSNSTLLLRNLLRFTLKLR